MRNKISLLGTIVFVISVYTSVAPAYDDWPSVSGPYLGQQPPGMTAEMFAPGIVSTDQSEVNSVFSPDGEAFYFQAVREEGYGKADIYRSSLIDGAYQTPENLGPVINSENYEGDAFVAPDESYLIITVYGREDGFGKGDLYISFRSPDGSWSPLKNMGSAINSAKRDFSPMVSPDGKYLFFSSKRAGKGDIFWVDAKVIEALNDEQE